MEEVKAINIGMEAEVYKDDIYTNDLYEDELFVMNDGM